MGYSYVVLGAGRQGTAIAYDLARFGEARSVRLMDQDAALAERSAKRVNKLIGKKHASGQGLDVEDHSGVESVLKDADVCVSAVPYRFNKSLTAMAIKTKTHFCDLGGNTDVVRAQIALSAKAKRAGVGIVPDCGLAPGMANSLALYIFERLQAVGASPQHIKILCGGLPQNPRPPLGYQMLFSMDGLINEYDSLVYSLRGGKIEELEPLTELEPVMFDEPVGQCEAFLTSGGTSTAAWKYEGLLQSYQYKTVRYPGHCDKIRAIRDLGMWDAQPVEFPGGRVAPRVVFARAAEPRLELPDGRDLVVLRVQGLGQMKKTKEPIRLQLDLIDFYDQQTGFTAMERTTGFPAAIVAILLAQGVVKPGANPPDPAVPAEPFTKALIGRGFRLRETLGRPLQIE